MARKMNMNAMLSSINSIKGTKKPAGKRGIGYAAAVAGRSNDVVEAVRKIDSGGNEESEYWVPHPRSGIYSPKGQDWVLEHVAHSPASSSSPHFWIRNIDGVDHPHSADYYF
ncbi:hypothetical protein V2J09_008762 [Rumex salicifolius]